MNKKDLLAKLLSTENITVSRQDVSTASFNVESRVLILPIWKNLSENIENMLIAHEVGHALYTPFLESNTKEFENNKLLHSWANVIEDVRIEKNIQNEYPGLKKDFVSAYKELIDRNFFGVKGRDLVKEQFINKANLFYKAGYNCGVKFTSEEYGYIKEIDNCETFNDVMKLARKLTAYSIAKKEIEKQALEKLAALYLQNSDSSEEGENLKDSLKDYLMEVIDEDLDESDSKTSNGESNPVVNIEDALNDDETIQDKFNKNVAKHTSKNEFFILDYNPKFVGFDPYVPYTKYSQDVDMWLSDVKIKEDKELEHYKKHNMEMWQTKEQKMEKASGAFKTYLQETKKEVNYLLKEFEMRKSANQYYKTKQHKSGIIDIRKLASYKIKEEIFKTIQKLPQGKNHGMVMLMDWSGSMTGILDDVIKQVYLMTSFCKIANIPFSVLAFTNGVNEYHPDKAVCDSIRDAEFGQRYISKTDLTEEQRKNITTPKQLDVEMFKLVEILSNKMSKDEYNKMGALLFSGLYKDVPNYKLASTPLNESLYYMLEYLPKFKKLNNIEKLSFLVLTDGEGHNLYPRRYESYNGFTKHLIIRKNNKEYDFKPYMQTGALIQMIKDQDPNTTCLAFSLVKANKRSIENILSHTTAYTNDGTYKRADESFVVKVAKDFKELGASALKDINSYDEYYLIPIEYIKPEALNTDSLNSNKTKTSSQIAKSFTKILKQNRNSRFLLTSLARQVA